jgi:hypothetical protein
VVANACRLPWKGIYLNLLRERKKEKQEPSKSPLENLIANEDKRVAAKSKAQQILLLPILFHSVENWMLSRHVSVAAARESNNRGIRNQCLVFLMFLVSLMEETILSSGKWRQAEACHRTSKVHCSVLVPGWWSRPSFVFFLGDSCLGDCTETNYGHDCHVDE